MLPTREEALHRLSDFVPRAGRDYAANRNYDRGPAERSNVSTLAPYVRCRLLTEEEILRAVLERFRPASATKFVQEIFWRAYWKGWLESRPAVWSDYRRGLASRLVEVERDRDLGIEYEAAVGGRTGIDAFDAWARELIETGYLHNHARMWFASIWIFTLLLPWELGADFFIRHLACGDPASNTLSWRWVAGLHTQGKTYLARASNIRHYTDERFDVGARLRTSAPALRDRAYPSGALPLLDLQPSVEGGALLILHDDDAGSESLPLATYDVRASVAVLAAAGRSPQPLGARAAAFARGALVDALSRAAGGGANEPIVAGDDVTAAAMSIAERADAVQAKVALTGFAPVGPVRDALDSLRAPLARRGVSLVEIGRRFDALAWPHATRGYFGLRHKIPEILRALDLIDASDA